MTVPVFLAADLSGSELVLDGPEGRHAAAVRRLREGERLDLTDGAGAVAEFSLDRVIAATLADLGQFDFEKHSCSGG